MESMKDSKIGLIWIDDTVNSRGISAVYASMFHDIVMSIQEDYSDSEDPGDNEW